MPEPPLIPAHTARTLLLGAQGLLANPRRRANEQELKTLITQLGFVQIDSINVVERAHHLTLASRLDGYKASMLHNLLERERILFEHWTHDASLIPIEYYQYWKPRFARHATCAKRATWWKARLGPQPEAVIEQVKRRIEQEGPLQSKDFEHHGKSGSWWGWKPQKVALEHLWRIGDLAITKRVNFQKVYDLSQRVFPEAHRLPAPHPTHYIDWACRSALSRLVIATPAEIAAFWRSITLAEARQWCRDAAKQGQISSVRVQAIGRQKPLTGYACSTWQETLDTASSPPNRVRLLCPFDPVVRDRQRMLRLFGFDYRFEAFVPAPKRIYGYYVLPILERDRIIGRVDPKFHRDRNGGGELVVQHVYLEKGVSANPARRERIEKAVARLAKQIGASSWRIDRYNA